MRHRSRSSLLLIAALALLTSHDPAWGHGTIGDRFFPTTLSVDDPTVNDEYTTLWRHRKVSGTAVRSQVSMEFGKRITSHLALKLEGAYRRFDLTGGNQDDGFGNLGLAAKYVVFERARQEALLTLGFETEIDGTGDREAGAESFSVYAPQVFFGKGFGDLPARFSLGRPGAITGLVAAEVPDRAGEPTVLVTGLVLEYSLPYLHDFVRDAGLPRPLRDMVPVVEMPLETCLSSSCGGEVNGSIIPGLIWMRRGLGQIGVGAEFPINDRSGPGVGLLVQLHLFLDELFPRTVGVPLIPTPHRH